MMSQLAPLHSYQRHLQDRYQRLLEKANDYRFVDEEISDFAAYKAMKILGKLNQISFFQSDIIS